jgi:protein-L-isoaspartate(D-aspartate) O-methyltransferase
MRPARLGIIIILFAGFYSCVFNNGCSLNRSSITQKGKSTTVATDNDNFAQQRERMVREQLKSRDIIDPHVLSAMLKVPRHEFVPPDEVEFAYQDGALPLSLGQTISQPYIVAFMTQLLDLDGTERVLEIGTGSGYQAAVLAEIAHEVYTIEILPELQKQAVRVLTKLGYRNIHFRVGDGYAGWPEHAPFDRIIVTAAPSEIPQPLIDQLNDGGRIVIPVGTFDQELVVLEKEKSGVLRRSSIPVRFVPMTGKAQETK